MISNLEQYKSAKISLLDLEREQNFFPSRQDHTVEVEKLKSEINQFFAQFTPIDTNLRELNLENAAPFSKDIIHNYDTYLAKSGLYLKSECKVYTTSIPMNKIIGIAQMYGDDATWEDCLNGAWLKRINRGLDELNSNPLYYCDSEEKSGVSFFKIEDKYFISQGKHRAVIARFFEHFNPHLFKESPLQNVHVTEFFVDREFLEMKGNIEEIANDFPDLDFQIEHTTSLNDRKFLLIHERRNFGNMECFTRAQYPQLISALIKPSVRDKWLASRMRQDSNIYEFISYSKCLKALF